MINAEKVIALAQQAGARMVYIWGQPPKVEDMDIMLYTKLLIQEALNEHNDNSNIVRGTGPDNSAEVEARPDIDSIRPVDGDIQLGRKGRKKANKENAQSVQKDT